MENVHQKHDTFTAIVGNKDSVNARKTSFGDTHKLTRRQVRDKWLVTCEALSRHLYESSLDWSWIPVKTHDVVYATG
jgi:hypothetical protein